jgi:hypothetical protein
MDQNTNNSTPIPEEKTPVASITSILVIVLVLAFGAFYFLKQVPVPADNATLTPAEAQADPAVAGLSTQGTSTDLTSIQNDLKATDLSGLDAGLGDISI